MKPDALPYRVVVGVTIVVALNLAASVAARWRACIKVCVPMPCHVVIGLSERWRSKRAEGFESHGIGGCPTANKHASPNSRLICNP